MRRVNGFASPTIAGTDGLTEQARPGVLVVPKQHRAFATATGDDQMVTLDEDTGAVLARSPTGSTPMDWSMTPAATRSGPPTNPVASKP